MKWTTALATAALLLLLAHPASAQGMTEYGFPGANHLRAAYGDVPLTSDVEPGGQWNVVDYVRGRFSGDPPSITFEVTPGFVPDGAWCTCGNVSRVGATVTLTGASPGDYVVALRSHLVASAETPVTLVYAPRSAPSSATIYVRAGQSLQASTAAAQVLPGADHPEYTINSYGSDLATPATFQLNGARVEVSAQPTSPWLYAAAGLLVGMALWAFLVSRGAVQRKSRKQVATTAAHVEAAKAEPVTVLEGRKRALMAALKEIELARQANELDVPTYDTIKSELKKEAVTVMRAIDEAKGQKAA